MTSNSSPPTSSSSLVYDPAKLPELIQSVVDQKSSSHSLQSLNQTILDGSESTDDDLDPLAIFPLLLPSTVEGSDVLLKTVGARCSPRESLIALQEATERLSMTNNEEDNGSDEDLGVVPTSIQLARILTLYSIVLPRLAKRKKSASEILRPLASQVQGVVPAVSQYPEAAVQNILQSLLLLANAVPQWIGGDPIERSSVATVLCDVLQEVVQYNANDMHSGLTAKAFERHYPNLRIPGTSTDGPSGNPASRTVADTLDVLIGLGFEPNILLTQPSISSLILIAHSAQPRLTEKTLETFLPIILAALQSNTALDETLALLLDTLGSLRNATPRPDLAVDILVPLVHVLAPLASVHPDPPTRHATFRILSIVLALSPSPIRLRLLKDLVTDEDKSMQQMRAAVIGLVKEAVLEALSTLRTTSGPSNVFSSPIFMQEIGSVLFLKQVEKIALDVVEFLESAEPLRLIESMGLLYILLLRDIDNRTGVRDRTFLQAVDRTLLTPLKERLTLWEKETRNSTELEHAVMQLGILDMCLLSISLTTTLKSTDVPSQYNVASYAMYLGFLSYPNMAPLFNECFEQTSYNLDLAQYNFMGMMLTAIAYGIHTLLLLTCIRPVYRRGIPLLSYVVAVFSLATVEFALQVWWYETVVIKGQFQHDEHRTLVQHHPHHTISLARTVVYIIMNWFSEGILLYRFYVIFHLIGGHAILFGVISFLVLSTLVVTGGICIPAITGLGFTWLPDICTSPGIAYLCLSISAHVILTSLIVVRLTLLRRKLLRTFGTDHGKVYISLVVILIESASLYTIWALTSLILYGKDSPGQFIVLPAQGQIQAICPLLIINWVVSGHALSRDTFSSSPSTLRLQSSIVFNDPEDILLPYPKPTYLSPTRSISKLPNFTTSSRDSLWTSENKDPLTRGSL